MSKVFSTLRSQLQCGQSISMCRMAHIQLIYLELNIENFTYTHKHTAANGKGRKERSKHEEGSNNGEDCEQTKIKAFCGDKETEKRVIPIKKHEIRTGFHFPLMLNTQTHHDGCY